MTARKRILVMALCSMLVLHLPAALAEEPLSYADMSVGGIAAGATPEQVESVLGAPDSREAPSIQPATGSTVQTLRYGGLTLLFCDGILNAAEYADATYVGPRGLSIGDTEDAVKAAFPYDGAMAEAHAGVLYAAGWVDALDMPLPPCGTCNTAENEYVVYRYLAPVTPYSAETLSNPESFLYERHACLTLTLSGDSRTVTGMSWQVGALAE